ncbi:hypothetical protein E3N88_25212 [Mikania micrantha]|uniref:Uncharacterized protein n=1 Tax=Mikania micrantha TaxID=192012 RepID=A0A5N6N4D3_9ASTR|nr:hypothetical protein E3N88_25212 [Mikania micrantha]
MTENQKFTRIVGRNTIEAGREENQSTSQIIDHCFRLEDAGINLHRSTGDSITGGGDGDGGDPNETKGFPCLDSERNENTDNISEHVSFDLSSFDGRSHWLFESTVDRNPVNF